MPFSRKRGDSNPSQAVRLIWFHLFFLSPMAAIAYVATYELKGAGQDALISVLFILAVSLIVSLFCAIAQPIQIIDESLMTSAGRANLCLAVVDTIIVEDANDLAGEIGSGHHVVNVDNSNYASRAGWTAGQLQDESSVIGQRIRKFA